MANSYISDVIDISKLDTKAFNLIASGCGTGKTHFVKHYLLEKFPDVKPYEVLFLTSRSLIVDQQSQDGGVDKFNSRDIDIIRYWNGEIDYDEIVQQNKINTMTYDKLIYILNECNNPDRKTLSEIKIVVCDECHTIFSDKFIKDMNALKLWMRVTLYEGEKVFIGLTATPNIMHYYNKQWGVKVNQLNKDVLVNYRAKHLICTSYDALPSLFRLGRLTGKSLIMCYSVSDCNKLKQKIPHSQVLISRSNKAYKKDTMDQIRNYIITENKLPQSIYNNGVKERLDVLITTSTLREGINLYDGCGVENVICCIPDELHISQFMGRCRFDIENLIIVNETIQRSQLKNPYIESNRREFSDYISDPNDTRWLSRISHLLYPDVEVERIEIDSGSFYKHIVDNWLNKRIISKHDRDSITSVARGCNLFDCQRSKITFIKVMKYIEEELGLSVRSGRITINGDKKTYKEITLPKDVVDSV